jgi:predicted transcriptional regulator
MAYMLFLWHACLGENWLHKRGRGTITIDILEATLTPQKKMRIMYRANLNYARFNKYFHDFLTKGFIEQTFDSEGKACYRISQRGKTLLAVLKKANELALTDEL